jgi:hypothetical protein
MRPILAAAAAVLLSAPWAAAQGQRGAPPPPERTIVVPAPAVTLSPPPPTVNVTTPPPTVNVTVPGPAEASPAPFGLTPGIGSFLGAFIGGLLGLVGVGLTAWIGTRNMRRQLVEQAAETRAQIQAEHTLDREAELRRSDGERRAIAAAFLAEVGAIRRAFQGSEQAAGDQASVVLVPDPRIPIFDGYTTRLHMLSFDTAFAVAEAYSTVTYLKTQRAAPADPEALGEVLRLHKTQLTGAIAILDRAHGLLKAAAGNLGHAAEAVGAPAQGAPASAAKASSD